MDLPSKYSQLEENYWHVSVGNLQRLNFLSYDTTYFLLDPTTINGFGANKNSVLSAGNLSSLYTTFTAPNISVPNASHFLQSNWNSLGWNVTSLPAFIIDVGHFINLNFPTSVVGSYDIIVVFGTVSGRSYALPMFYEGNRITGTPSFITATGGTITTSGNMKIHTFTSNGTFQITAGIGVLNSLLVGGGGGGGNAGYYASGGGGGGVLSTSSTIAPAGSYPIVVGGGGSAGGLGSQGGNSTFNGLTAFGGGGGSTATITASGTQNGGSGAGGTSGTGPGTGVAGQGNAGGAGTSGSGGGGGGAGAVGGGASGAINATAFGGTGGNGIASSITGSSVTYGGGGGGGGSGNGSGSGNGGGNGGSGIVIIAYQYQ